MLIYTQFMVVYTHCMLCTLESIPSPSDLYSVRILRTILLYRNHTHLYSGFTNHTRLSQSSPVQCTPYRPLHPRNNLTLLHTYSVTYSVLRPLCILCRSRDRSCENCPLGLNPRLSLSFSAVYKPPKEYNVSACEYRGTLSTVLCCTGTSTEYRRQ